MAMATVLSRAQHGMDAPLVRVEVDLGSGLPRFAIVGLPEAVVKESKDRVRAAIAQLQASDAGRAHHRQSVAGGSAARKACASICRSRSASCSLPGKSCGRRSTSCELYGELSLGGEIRPVRGALLAAIAAARAGHRMIVPPTNVAETLLVTGCRVAVAKHLLDVVGARDGIEPAELRRRRSAARCRGPASRSWRSARTGASEARARNRGGGRAQLLLDRSAGHRQEHAGAAVAGAVAADERRRSTRSRSDPQRRGSRRSGQRNGACGRFAARITRRPRSRWWAAGRARVPARFRSRITACCFWTSCRSSIAACSKCCASRSRAAAITISRAARQAEFPATFQFIAAMNPCPCGYLGDAQGRCRCTAEQVQRYRSRLSGPLHRSARPARGSAARADARVLAANRGTAESSAAVAARVLRAREQQIARQGTLNSRLDNKAVERFCATTREANALLNRAAATLGLSARALSPHIEGGADDRGSGADGRDRRPPRRRSAGAAGAGSGGCQAEA